MGGIWRTPDVVIVVGITVWRITVTINVLALVERLQSSFAIHFRHEEGVRV
jgi:hypothetical protein